jgi:hypothetical protein
MRNYSGMILAFLVTAVIFAAGCTNQPPPEVSVPSTIPTTPVPATASPSVTVTSLVPTPPLTFVTTTPSVHPTTPLPPADPTDVAQITFVYYYDNDFSVEYPSTWILETSAYTPYPVGPFYSYDDPRFNIPYRVVTITSPDNTIKFVALTQEFKRAGTYRLDPTIELYRKMFQRDYRDLSAASYLGNYKYFSSGTAMASTYDVTLPEGTNYYPSAYTVKTVVSLRHEYNFGFFTDRNNFGRYQNLKEKMISSVKTPETEIHYISNLGNSSIVI